MHTFLLIAVGVVAGIIIGYVLRAAIAERVLTTVSELKSWRQRLDSAATADVATAKREMQSIATEIRAKV